MTVPDLPQDMTLLLVDDDKPFLTRLARAMESRGFAVRMAETVAEGIEQVRRTPPGYAVVDLRLSDGSGLDVIEALHNARSDARAVVLTGYGNIATAVTAVKLGAIDYLAKPADADAVYGALMAEQATPTPRCRKIRCRPTGCAGSTSSASTNCAIATCRRRRGA